MSPGVPPAAYDRVIERRHAVALAHHFRDAEGLSIVRIADRLGRSPATIKAYFYDPTGEKARAVKARYQGVCRGCGAYTQPRNGKGDAYAYCKRCHPGAIELRWTRESVLDAMREWRERDGRLPSSHDWSRTHARRTRVEALKRLATGEWPSATQPRRPLCELERLALGRYQRRGDSRPAPLRLGNRRSSGSRRTSRWPATALSPLRS
jgi:AraC-like DNA-binding protein